MLGPWGCTGEGHWDETHPQPAGVCSLPPSAVPDQSECRQRCSTVRKSSQADPSHPADSHMTLVTYELDCQYKNASEEERAHGH